MAEAEQEYVDVEHERSLKVTRMMESGETEKQAREQEKPLVPEGAVFVSLDSRDVDGRFVRVQAPEDSKGQVTVENLVTRRVSHIKAESLLGGTAWRRRD